MASLSSSLRFSHSHSQPPNHRPLSLSTSCGGLGFSDFEFFSPKFGFFLSSDLGDGFFFNFFYLSFFSYVLQWVFDLIWAFRRLVMVGCDVGGGGGFPEVVGCGFMVVEGWGVRLLLWRERERIKKKMNKCKK